MNRRSFIELAASAFAANGISGSAAAQTPENRLHFVAEPTAAGPTASGPFQLTQSGKRPHIVMISMDMVSPDLYHPGRPLSKHVKIPNINALMQQGTFFSNAFCTVPLCSPSRASYLTGRYSYIVGNGERAPAGLTSELRPDDIIFPQYLSASGYAARQVGKSHVGTQNFVNAFGVNDQPWNRWSPPVFDDDDFLNYQRRLGVKPQKYSREIIFKQQDRTTPGNSVGGWIVQQDGKPFPLEAQYSYYLGTKAIDLVEDLIESGAAKSNPIYLQLDIFDPHQPFSIPAGFEERERELRRIMTLPETYEAARARDFKRAADEPEIMDIYRRYWGIYDPATLLDYRVAYALQMELVDGVVGMVLDRLKALDIYDEALIVVISDHGEMNGRQALVDKGVFLYPDVVRVPLVVKAPASMKAKPAVVSTSVSLLDVSQTILEAAGIEAQAKFDGRSLFPLIQGTGGKGERTLLFFGGWHVGVNFVCGIQHQDDNGHFLYAYNCTSREDELFDLNAVDAVNLITRPEHAQTRHAMIGRLGAALQIDPRWLGYWAEFRIARYNDLPKVAGDMQLFVQPD